MVRRFREGAGQNLLDETHEEASGAQVPRTVFAMATYEFGR